MTRFFFDVCNSDGLHRDEFGDDFESFEEARDQARMILPDIAREKLPGGDLYTVTCDVRDEEGRVVYRGKLTFEGTRGPVRGGSNTSPSEKPN